MLETRPAHRTLRSCAGLHIKYFKGFNIHHISYMSPHARTVYNFAKNYITEGPKLSS
jgi:hypothetical protein